MEIKDRIKANEEALSKVRMDIAMKEEETRQLNERLVAFQEEREGLEKEQAEEEARQRYVGKALETIKALQKQVQALSKYSKVSPWKEGEHYTKDSLIYYDGAIYKAKEDTIAGPEPDEGFEKA